jgi:hypothetical protein
MRPTLMSAATDDDARVYGTPLARRASNDATVRQGGSRPCDSVVADVKGVRCAHLHENQLLGLCWDDGIILAAQLLAERRAGVLLHS